VNWKIKVSSNAEKYIKKLGKKTRKRIIEKLKELENMENPLFHSHVKPLVGELKGFYRLKSGKYRIIFALLKKEKIIAVVNITSRGKSYK